MTECPSTVMSMTSTTFLTVIVILYAAGTSGGVACRIVMTARAVVLDESAVTVLEPIEGIEDVFTGVADVRKATPSTSAVAEMSGLTESPSTGRPRFLQFWTGTTGSVDWSGKRESNRRPSAWEADALPTELFPLTGPSGR